MAIQYDNESLYQVAIRRQAKAQMQAYKNNLKYSRHTGNQEYEMKDVTPKKEILLIEEQADAGE